MAQLGYIDPNAEERPTDRFDPLPDGWYAAQLIETDVVPTKAGNGQLLTYTAEIIEGPFERRRVWGRINIINQSAEAQEIGQRELRQLSEAVGYQWPLPANADSNIFQFKPLMARVGRRKDDREKNEVKGWKGYVSPLTNVATPRPSPQPQASPQQSQTAPHAAQAYTPPPQQQAAAGGSRPWR